ncbi:MAG: hypothetical protein EA376_08710 [Phycisphaeraceae bacterium]|nr:MAG: hypothetical protein EA376_08710 [Phycisphaeraceae bacterium]
MSYKPKPHVSAALRHLRLSVIICAAALGACLLLHILVWAFVHYTDARWTEVKATDTPRDVVVVEPGASQSENTRSLSDPAHPVSQGRAAQTESPRSGAEPLTVRGRAATRAPADVNRVLSRNDSWFRSISSLSQTVGVVAALTLMLLMIQGVIVAGGANVPGVERAVTSTSWTIVIALLCLPLADVFVSLPFGGVFCSYASMTASSEAIRAGAPDAPTGMQFYGQHLLIPLVIFATLVIVTIRFHMGVEEGVIVTSMSELDEKLDREMSSIKFVATRAPRSVGALHRAMGDNADDVSPSLTRASRSPLPDPVDEPLSDEPPRRIKDPQTGKPMQRPI